MEAARARRLRSMAELQLGTELVRQNDGCWRVNLAEGARENRDFGQFRTTR